MTRTNTHHKDQKPHTPFLSRPAVRRLTPFVLITAVALVFIFENTASTEIRLLVPQVTMPLWGALLIAWGLGMLACAFAARRRRDRHAKRPGV
ncbi:hypothetical protein [Streptomyces boluensis]|uniref:DUF1049 domain-containing protein n=1 Tax=Streptomyces boluensis TaxID=1775135 RepID=A0A964UPT0_9ACTN|nr:hypothetical protein [Streptomyces boluensis]NBE53178.1 hypothetical protein [Streptomyces boluensis]